MIDPTILLITSGSAARIAASEKSWGGTTIAVDLGDGVFGVVGTSSGDEEMVLDQMATESHPITLAGLRHRGVWAVVDPDLHGDYQHALRVHGVARLDDFRRCVPAVPDERLQSDGSMVVTRAPDATPEWAAWRLSGQDVEPLEVDVLRPIAVDPIHDLGPHWPVHDLDRRVVVVGLGSIGSAAAHALARYGVRDLALVDPERLLSHNLVRHQCGRGDVGRFKVAAVRDALVYRWPGIQVDAFVGDVIVDADGIRPLLRDSALVLCAADGVAARRCVNHLARRAGCTAVFACVLRDGAVGEVLRVRPWPGTGCLLCVRALLIEHGTIDPEPALDADYGRPANPPPPLNHHPRRNTHGNDRSAA